MDPKQSNNVPGKINKAAHTFTKIAEIKSNIEGESISMIKYSPNGEHIAMAIGNTLQICFLETCQVTETFYGHTGPINDISWSPCSRKLCTCSDDNSVIIWSLGGAEHIVLTGHISTPFCVQWSPLGGIIASGGFDESIRIWNAREPSCIRTILAHCDPVTSLSFSSDGALLASSSYDGLIRIWDMDGKCRKTIVDNDNPAIGSILYSQNGKYILCSTLDSTVRLWSVSDGKCLKSFKGHLNEKLCLKASFLLAENRQMVTMPSEDGRILVWSLSDSSVLMDYGCCEEENNSISSCDVFGPNIAIASMHLAKITLYRIKF